MRLIQKTGTALLASVFMTFTAMPAITFAHGASLAESTTGAVKKAAAAEKLADTKLKVCQQRETKINNILSRISDRGQKQLDLFTKIADRTKQFYTDKGRTVSNYDALVAEVDAKKAAATTLVSDIKEHSVEFKCDGTDPKGVAESFKEVLKSEIDALKAYKTAVKNLIVGVKSAQSTSEDKTKTETETEGSTE